MQHGDAPGPGSAKLKRQRKVVALGAAGDQARRLQELGDALDDLVRALRSGDALAEGLSRRVHELWASERAHVFEWHPTELRAAGKLVLGAGAQGGRFILPAFTAGLRAVAMREQCSPADVIGFAHALAALESCALSPQTFAGWLWRGAALGFDTAQHESVFELSEGTIAEIDEAALWAERSKQGVDVWNDLAWKAAQAFDARAIGDRFRAPLERMQQRLQRSELGLGDEEIRALRGLADDEAAWGRVEIKLLLQLPVLRSTLSSSHLTWRLAAVIEGASDLSRLPDLFTRLGGFQGGAQPALDAAILGEAFGRRLLGRGVAPAALLEIAEQAGPELVAGLLGHLNTRSDCGDAAQGLLQALLQQGGLRSVLARIDAARMQPAFACALVRAACEARVSSAELTPLFGRLTARSLLAVLGALPVVLRTAEPALQALIGDRPEHVEPLLPEFVRTGPQAAQSVGAAILRAHAAGFTAEGLLPILSAFVELGLGGELVLPLWESRKAQTGVRLAALGALACHRGLLAEAMRRRGADAIDPPEIQIALEELRWRQPWSAAQSGAQVLERTIELLDRLFALVRLVALHGDEHEQVAAGARALQSTIAEARPPFALQLLPEAVLRDGQPLPLDLEMYRRSQQLVGALARWKMTELAFDAVPEADGLTALAAAVLDATRSNRTARVPDVEHVRLRALRRPGLLGAAAGEAALELFAARQIDRALVDLERVMAARAAAWPWSAGRAILWRLERCMIASTGATARCIELAPAPWTPARRALALAFYVSAVLGRLQTALLVQRATAHAALAVGCTGLCERPGMALAEAAQALLPRLMPQVGEAIDTDPHRLRATALLASAAHGERALAELPVLALIHASYEIERQRCPPIAGLQLSRADLHAWLAGALGRELHAGWGRAVLDVLGPIPPGSHVLAEGRLAVVLGAAPRADPWRPRVLVGGQPTVPSQPVTLYSPLAMTPWAK